MSEEKQGRSLVLAAVEMNGKVGAGFVPAKTGLYTGTPCQTKTQSACLTCGFLDSIHLLLA